MTAADRFVIVTGGPGAGKTTLIAELARRGLSTAAEAGRAVIRAQQAAGGAALPWADRGAFADLMSRFDRQSYLAARQREGFVVFDRGIPDVIGYRRLCGLPVPPELDALARGWRYRREVFVAPAWREIYENDAERRQDFAEASLTCETLIGVYRDYGYDFCVLPQAGVAERAQLVLDRICAG